MHIHTHLPRPSEFTSAPSNRLLERTSPIASHIDKILPGRVLYLHFCTINSLSYSVRCRFWNTDHGGSPSVVRTGGRRMAPYQGCTAGEESPSISVLQVSHPWPKMYVWIRVVVMNGDVHFNVRSLVPELWLPQELGEPVTVDRMAGFKKSAGRMPSWSQKIVAIIFPTYGPDWTSEL